MEILPTANAMEANSQKFQRHVDGKKNSVSVSENFLIDKLQSCGFLGTRVC